MYRSLIVIFITCFLFLFHISAVFGKEKEAATGDIADSNNKTQRHIQYSFTLQNKTNKLIEKGDFWTYAPVKETATQRTVKLETSHTYELIIDELGNQILHFELYDLAPYATKIISIKAYLEISINPEPASLQNTAFLKAEKNIESDNPEILTHAKKLNGQGSLATAENIFKWVSSNIEYAGYVKDDRGALYALKEQRGDCTEYMSLFVALNRANKIPARGIGGYVVKENMILKPYEYHNWAEFYDEGKWKIADPQNKVFVKDQSSYIAMRIIGESSKNPMGDYNRFRYKGDGLQVKMNK